MTKDSLEAEITAYLEDLIDISIVEATDFNEGRDFEQVVKELNV